MIIRYKKILFVTACVTLIAVAFGTTAYTSEWSFATGSPVPVLGPGTLTGVNTTGDGLATVGGKTAMHFGPHDGSAGYQLRVNTLSDPTQFTMVFDLFVATSNNDGFLPLWNGSATNANDAELFLRPSTGGYWSGSYFDSPTVSWAKGQWNRFVYVNDNANGASRIYINGVLSQEFGLSPDYIYSGVTNPAWLLTDNAGETTDAYILNFAFTDELLTASEAAALGGASETGIFATSTPDPIETVVGPYVQFTGPHTAVVRWDTSDDCDSIVEYGLSTSSLNSRVHTTAETKKHEVVLNDIHIKDKYFFRVGSTISGSEQFGDVFWFDNNINYSRVSVADADSPYGPDALTPLYEQAADYIVSQSGVTKGICLVYGCGEGRLAFELAKRTDMMIVGVDTDSAKIETAAQKLVEAGVYGARVTVRQVPTLDNLPFSKFMANLIVSDTMIATGQCPGSSSEMFRLLRPSGGVALLGQPTGCPTPLTQPALEGWLNGLSYNTTNDSEGLWSKVVRPDLPGAGWWTHAHGGPDGAGNSNDSLEGGRGAGDFELQWVSWPGADAKVDRQVRGHSPITNKGRMAFRGFNRIITLDTYNGSILWSLEIPGLNRFNIPRDSGWFCIDDDSVYLAVDDDCWKLDTQTGQRVLTHQLDDDGYDWGNVIRYNDKLYGSAVLDGSFYTGWWGSSNWYESQDSKICSKYLFANNLDGSRAWTYDSADPDKGVIINSTVCMGGGRVYFVESRNPSAESLTTGRIGSQLWTNMYLVALNSETGVRVWEQDLKSGAGGNPVVANGTAIIHLMYSDETVVLECSDTQYYIYAYNASTGAAKWNKSASWPKTGRDHGSHLQRVVISNGRVWGAGSIHGLSLVNGSTPGGPSMPLTICGTVSAAGDVFMGRFNKGDMKVWDSQNGALSEWDRIRTSCYINVLGCGGMILAPEGGGGCDCYDGGFHTSTAFIKSEN